MVASVWLYWIPVGAGQHVVRRSTRVFETLDARRHHRPQRTLYHAALEVQLDAERWTVEMAPAWGGGRPAITASPPPARSGSAASAPRGSSATRCACGATESVPDLGFAVGDPVHVATDQVRTRRLLAAGSRVPGLTWGRDELGLGDMWNSNSLVAWLLATSGHDVTSLAPPGGGRAPGWTAGLELARRTDQVRCSTAASSSTPSTSRGPGRAHIPSASTACTRTPAGSRSRERVCLSLRAGPVVAARRHDHDVRAGGAHVVPGDRGPTSGPRRRARSRRRRARPSRGSSGRGRTAGRSTRARRRAAAARPSDCGARPRPSGRGATATSSAATSSWPVALPSSSTESSTSSRVCGSTVSTSAVQPRWASASSTVVTSTAQTAHRSWVTTSVGSRARSASASRW